MLRLAVGILVCLLGIFDVYAVERLANQKTLAFDRITPEDGLSQGIVTAFVQDKDGFVWIGTQEGLNRYDGEHFVKYFHEEGNPHTLLHDHIQKLLVDSSGRLWVATDYGINLYRDQTKDFLRLELSEDSEPVYALAEGTDGSIWLGTSQGLYRSNQDGLGFSRIGLEFEGLAVRSLLVRDSNQVLVGTESHGLYSYIVETDFVQRFDVALLDSDVRDLLQVGNELWIGTFNGGVTKLDLDSRETVNFGHRADSSSLTSNRVRSLLADHENNVWIGTDRGLHFVDASEEIRVFQHDLSNPRSISDNTILSMYQDSGGVIWVGTYNGLSKWNAKVELFSYFRRPASNLSGVESNNITAFAEDESGNVWVGTLSGLLEWNTLKGELVPHNASSMGLLDSRVMSLTSFESAIWAGTMNAGIHRIKEGRVVEVLSHDPSNPQSLSSNAITKMYKDTHGELWVTTYGGGVNRYLGNGKFEQIAGEEGISDLSNLRSLDIVEVRSGEYWIATQGDGVVILDSNSGSTEVLRHSSTDRSTIPSNEVITLLAEKDGVWIGTVNRGLAYFDHHTGMITRYSKADGLASDAVYGLLKDSRGRIWTTGGKGMSMLDPETDVFRLFDSTHGLQSSDFNSGAYAMLQDGTFLFGGNNGFNAFYPESIRLNSHVPPIHITQIKLFNQPIDERIRSESESLRLRHDDSVISFEFAALDYTSPQKNDYRFMLEGFDRGWRDSEGSREVTYTNLDAGNYVFRVTGSNNDGVWNTEGTSITFTVAPAPWLSWWAYSVYSAIVLALLFVGLRANSNRLQRRAEKQYSEQLQLYIESLEEASDGIMIADSEGKLLYANHTTVEGMGKSAGEVRGESLYEVLFESESDRNHARESLQNDGRYHGEVRFKAEEKEAVIHEVTIAAVQQSSNSGQAYVGISRDVTQRKATEAQLEVYRKGLEQLVEQRTQALQKEIAENKAIQVHLANSLQEKELLLKEVHHRVKNNMQVISSLLSIQSEGVADEVYSNLLNESQQRIKSMALIHETLYQSKDLLKIDFQEYIETLSTSLSRSYRIPGVEVQVLVNVEDVALDLDTAVPCGLIINELVSNSLKHAFVGVNGSGRISVHFVATGCSYELKISDSGVGLPESFDPTRSSSMGMEIVSILTTQLEGTLSFRNDRGATFEISFPRMLSHA